MHKTPNADQTLYDSLEGTEYDLTGKETSLHRVQPLMMSGSRKWY